MKDENSGTSVGFSKFTGHDNKRSSRKLRQELSKLLNKIANKITYECLMYGNATSNIDNLFNLILPGAPGGTPRKIRCGFAARFPKPLPYL